MKDLTHNIRCPLKSEEGKCKSPYKNRDSPVVCPMDSLDCERYRVYEEVERQRRYRFREMMRN